MICAVVLAAGLSRRMGAQKLLLPFASKTVIAHIV
ncbi:MAG: NTP transferase domain-containing protein, partial [Planctomycetota bacterium]